MRTDDAMLEHHLQNNFFPPYDVRLVPYCQIAIEKAEADDWESEITIKGDGGEMTVTVAKMVDDFHLGDFVAAQKAGHLYCLDTDPEHTHDEDACCECGGLHCCGACPVFDV